MQDRPSADELLEAVALYLQDNVMPGTRGQLSFHARVAANVVEMLRRELAHEESHADAEWRGLDALLGLQERPRTGREGRAALRDRNQALVEQIRTGVFDSDPARTALFAHLRRVVHDKLVVANPALAAGG
jgi:hypothetical protein